MKVTTIHHKDSGDETEVEWWDDIIPEEAKPWLWGPPEEHDLTDDPIDIWTKDGAVEEIKQRTEPIVKARVYRNIILAGLAGLSLLKALWQLLQLLLR